jgi:hypothetical protein
MTALGPGARQGPREMKDLTVASAPPEKNPVHVAVPTFTPRLNDGRHESSQHVAGKAHAATAIGIVGVA